MRLKCNIQCIFDMEVLQNAPWLTCSVIIFHDKELFFLFKQKRAQNSYKRALLVSKIVNYFSHVFQQMIS